MSSFESRIDRFCQAHPEAPREDILATRLLFRTTQLLRAHIDRALAPYSLNMSQYLVLSLLSTDRSDPSSPSELSHTLDATRTQMTRFLDSLQSRGLVRRIASEQDRRSLELELTSTGRDLLRQAVPAVHRAYRQAWSVLAGGERDQASRNLQRLYANLQQLEQ